MPAPRLESITDLRGAVSAYEKEILECALEKHRHNQRRTAAALNLTYDQLRHEGMDKIEAILETCRERARPVVLTALTAIFGVLPIAFGLNLELLSHETTIGAPSTQWWISLSSAIVYGLAFATILTLIVTPSLLMLVSRSNAPRKGRGWKFWTKRAA